MNTADVLGETLTFNSLLAGRGLSEFFDDRISFIASSKFAYVSDLKEVALPNCTLVNSSGFYSCSDLERVVLPACRYLDSAAFWGCTNLSEIYVGSTCKLSNYAFSSTGITSSTGSIFVPMDTVESYKVSAGWSSYSTQIFGY